jgi:hypothetical protein
MGYNFKNVKIRWGESRMFSRTIGPSVVYVYVVQAL